MELSQEEKATRLQKAVINSSAREISKLYDALGEVEMSAPALGLACRFRGLDVVKALVGKGATFDFPSTEEIAIKYHCHIGEEHARYRENYRTNYSLYLLKCYRGGVKGASCLKGMKFEKNAKREDGSTLPFLADQERIAVLGYLIEKRQELSFQPEEMLFYAIFAKDTVVYEELKKRGVSLSEKRICAITDGILADGYWFEFGAMTKKLADQDYIKVMQQLSLEVHEKPFRYTEKMFYLTQKRFHDIDIFAFFLAHFNQKKMKKYQIIRGLIDESALDALAVIGREGWLAAPQKRDEMIAYAAQTKNTEALAWLLDYKNRTTDLAVEQDKAEKRMMRELNAAPDSVMALKKIWSYRKEEDGTLTITNYKGTAVEVIVPERIGKSVVTAIGKAAFTGQTYMKAYDRHRLSVADRFNQRVTDAQISQHREITKIVLPETIQSIGAGAFDNMWSLREINLPAGVKEIGFSAFASSSALKRITLPENIEKIRESTFFRTALEEIVIPQKVREIEKAAFVQSRFLKRVTINGNVKKIGEHAFGQCVGLEMLHICEGVEEIGEAAFNACISLKTLTIPGTVKVIKQGVFGVCELLESVYICEGVEEIEEGAFVRCRNLKEVHIPKSVQHIRSKENGQCHYPYDVFEECPNLTVFCPKGSRAEAYCKEKDIKCINFDISGDF